VEFQVSLTLSKYFVGNGEFGQIEPDDGGWNKKNKQYKYKKLLHHSKPYNMNAFFMWGSISSNVYRWSVKYSKAMIP